MSMTRGLQFFVLSFILTNNRDRFKADMDHRPSVVSQICFNRGVTGVGLFRFAVAEQNCGGREDNVRYMFKTTAVKISSIHACTEAAASLSRVYARVHLYVIFRYNKV